MIGWSEGLDVVSLVQSDATDLSIGAPKRMMMTWMINDAAMQVNHAFLTFCRRVRWAGPGGEIIGMTHSEFALILLIPLKLFLHIRAIYKIFVRPLPDPPGPPSLQRNDAHNHPYQSEFRIVRQSF